MKMRSKIIVILSTILFVMLILPVIILNFANADSGLALCLILFFIVCPITVVILGAMAGSDIRALWWVPLVSALAFTFFFSLAVGEMVYDLFIYSSFYFLISSVSALVSYLSINRSKNNKNTKT